MEHVHAVAGARRAAATCARHTLRVGNDSDDAAAWTRENGRPGLPLSDAGYAHRAQEELVLAKRHGWGSLDLHGLTKSLPRAASWDGMHFREDVTLCLNQELLTAISMCCPPAPL